MEPFATVDDVESVWRPLTDAEKVVADGLLVQASAKLRARVPNIDARVADSELVAALAKIAVVNAVKRVLQNPEATRQISETAGPFSRNVTVDTALSSGLLYISDDDLADLVGTGFALGTARLWPGLA
jgi:hypothetical protein